MMKPQRRLAFAVCMALAPVLALHVCGAEGDDSDAESPVDHPVEAVVIGSHVNVRGQPTTASEIVTRLQKGDHVTVLEELNADHSTNQPDKWSRIALPTNVTVWVHSGYIDASNNTVIPKRLNLRNGPGENFSILGRVQRGAEVQALKTQGVWWEINPPTNAYAFVASFLLSNVEPSMVAGPVPEIADTNQPPVAQTAETNLLAAGTTNAPLPVAATNTTEMDTNGAVARGAESIRTNLLASTTNSAASAWAGEPTPVPEANTTEDQSVQPDEPLPKRVVTREGFVRNSVSIQAPTYFVLESLDTGRKIDYLYSSTTNIQLRNLQGQKILVTGEESLDERWPRTPVLTIEKLQTLP